MNLLHSITLASSYDEIEKLEGFLNKIQSELKFDDEFYARLMLTVSEAATNAIVHGNKLDKNKTVTIQAFKDETRLTIKAKDQGEGFEKQEVPDPLAEENLLKPSGRGIFLMEEYADSVSFSENGTVLSLGFNLPE